MLEYLKQPPHSLGFPGAQVKESTAKVGDAGDPLGQEDPLEEEMATHSSILACKIPWTQELGGLQSMGSQRDTTERLSTHTGLHSPSFQRAPRCVCLLGLFSCSSPREKSLQDSHPSHG